MEMKKIYCLFLLLVFPVLLFAQTAEKLEELLDTPAVSYEQAAWFALQAADMADLSGTPEAPDSRGAFDAAVERQWFRGQINSADSARLDMVSLLLMNSFGIKGGMFYSLFKNPHYAYRELVYQEVIQGRTDPAMNVSGHMLVFMVNRILAGLETPGSWE